MDSYQNTQISGHGTSSGNGANGAAIDDKGPSAKKYIFGGVAVVLLFSVAMLLTGKGNGNEDAVISENSGVKVAKNGKLKLFDDLDRYVVEDFDSKPTFSDFLPGVAGLYGKPVWSFYVNRGQGITSFGTGTKDYPILEFNPANKAYQLTPFVGFRTFIQGSRGMSSFTSEPFSPDNARITDGPDEEGKPKRIMYVGTNGMEVREMDIKNGITTSAKYFVLPEEDFPALVRRATFTNTGSSDLKISALDGLAKIEPRGGELDGMLKNMGRTLEGWMGVEHVDDSITMPFFKMSTEPGDSASVVIEKAGHYCLSFIEIEDKIASLLPIVYDTSKVFGQNTPLAVPSALYTTTIGEILAGPQYGDARTSSAFSAIEDIVLAPGENVTIATFYGMAETIEAVKPLVDIITQPGWVQDKFELARTLMDELTAAVETKSANHLFNGAIKQMYMDNCLRGGLPTILGDIDETTMDRNYDEDERVKVFHSFSRIHGDLERDYNAFSIDPTYYSQGPGNYRDVAQNRRNDVAFLPRIGSFDISLFLSYIQADGYEPLTVEAVSYTIYDKDEAKRVASKVAADEESAKILSDIFVGGAFRPGQLFQLTEQLGINISVTNDEFINQVVSISNDNAMAVYGQGYWADHWEYYLDMIEAYVSIYPDGEEALMFDKEIRYFFSTATVKPRSKKYVLTYTYDAKSKHVLQLDSTYYDTEKANEQEAFKDVNTGRIGIDAYWQRTPEGPAFKSSPIAKLFLLGAMKFSMRDAYGMGVEYEGGRPGWNDAMNGLPGMVGSGMPETYEMYLVLKYVKDTVKKFQRSVVIPKELHTMISQIEEALDTLEASGYTDPEELPLDVPSDLFWYWDRVASARENYRNDVQYYFSGETVELSASDVDTMFSRWIAEVELGMARAFKISSSGIDDDGNSGISPAYFSYDVTNWTLNEGKNDVGLPTVNADAMRVGTFPLFLEGPVRYMKTINDNTDKLKDTYNKVLSSGLRDDHLKMYTISSSLVGQSYDMGRMMAFAPGWLENQSIWLHMSYKYYLQLIRGKLYDEFFSEMIGGGMLPFMDPQVYGRSLMQCSSFLASSAFSDPMMQGRGFLARLSGSTAEFLSIWKLMFVGPTPFFLDGDKLRMQLVPALPSWLFEDEEEGGTYDDDGNLIVSFKLFSAISVTYHNSEGKNLYGENPTGYKVTLKDGTVKDFDGPALSDPVMADAIRRVRTIESIDAFF